jgi:hypothetical protein
MKILIFYLTIVVYTADVYNRERFSSDDEETELRTILDIEGKIDIMQRMMVKNAFEELITDARDLVQKCSPIKDFLKPIKTKFPTDFSKCSDPTPNVMMKNLVKLNFMFKNLNGIMDIDSVQYLFKNLIIQDLPTKKNSLVLGAKRCEDENSNSTEINEMTICPWITRIEIRENKYPYMVTHAVCSCVNCLHLNEPVDDVKYGCQLVYRLTPALIRNEKCNGGSFEWKPILEKIAVTCVCSRSETVLLAI